MQNNSQTYEQHILPGTKAGSTCSQEVFPVNRFQLPESEKEPKMTATCGPKCSELFGLFDPAGSWARTFTGLLVGRTGWYSNRCALTWKRKVTKSNRMYFQLAVSALPTKGTGHGLLPTAQTQGLKMCENGKTKFYPVGLLPTPKVQDCRHAKRDRSKSNLGEEMSELAYRQTGQTSQLNPLFVEEMMGFPTGWILTPFLKESQHPDGPKPTTGGRSRPSKPTETP